MVENGTTPIQPALPRRAIIELDGRRNHCVGRCGSGQGCAGCSPKWRTTSRTKKFRQTGVNKLGGGVISYHPSKVPSSRLSTVRSTPLQQGEMRLPRVEEQQRKAKWRSTRQKTARRKPLPCVALQVAEISGPPRWPQGSCWNPDGRWVWYEMGCEKR